jgi:hypothetical protein
MVVIGGVAMTLRGADYVTLDLDLCFDRSPDNIQLLCRTLAPICPTIRSAFIDTVNFLVANLKGEKFSTDLGDIDLLGEVSGLGDYAAVAAIASPVALRDFSVQALTLEGLIRAKEAANRDRDKPHLIALRALKQMEDEEASQNG